jgi:hypothetical protein
VRLAHVHPERLGPLHQGADVGVPAQQVLDQRPAQRLLDAHHVASRRGVAVGEARDRAVSTGPWPVSGQLQRMDPLRELLHLAGTRRALLAAHDGPPPTALLARILDRERALSAALQA